MRSPQIFRLTRYMLVLFSFASCLQEMEEDYIEEADVEGEVIVFDDDFAPNTQHIFIDNMVEITFLDGQTTVSNPFASKGVRVYGCNDKRCEPASNDFL